VVTVKLLDGLPATFVPLRFISEAFWGQGGMEPEYKGHNNSLGAILESWRTRPVNGVPQALISFILMGGAIS